MHSTTYINDGKPGIEVRREEAVEGKERKVFQELRRQRDCECTLSQFVGREWLTESWRVPITTPTPKREPEGPKIANTS